MIGDKSDNHERWHSFIWKRHTMVVKILMCYDKRNGRVVSIIPLEIDSKDKSVKLAKKFVGLVDGQSISYAIGKARFLRFLSDRRANMVMELKVSKAVDKIYDIFIKRMLNN